MEKKPVNASLERESAIKAPNNAPIATKSIKGFANVHGIFFLL